jgi:hypothetical protein
MVGEENHEHLFSEINEVRMESMLNLSKATYGSLLF